MNSIPVFIWGKVIGGRGPEPNYKELSCDTHAFD